VSIQAVINVFGPQIAAIETAFAITCFVQTRKALKAR
jgi:hypothetical protein